MAPRLESVPLFGPADAALGDCDAAALPSFSAAAANDYRTLGDGFDLGHPDDLCHIKLTFWF